MPAAALPFPLTDRFAAALGLAQQWHHGQYRKGTSVPYLAHLLSVSALALEFGASEDEAVAALLHDALEDGPEYTGRRPDELRAELASQFGEPVALLVDAATDDTPLPGQEKAPWVDRKRQYLSHLPSASASELLVSACDKLHNARSILLDVLSAAPGEDVFARFRQGRDGTLQYYRLLADTYLSTSERADVAARPRLVACFRELERAVSALEAQCGLSAAEVRELPLLR